MNSNQKKLLDAINNKGALFDIDEATQFYVDNVQRRNCRVGFLDAPKDATEYDWYTIRQQATSFYLNAIGRLVLNGEWHIAEIEGVTNA